ncbi:hypothetical protein CCB80_05325 [Armatimonadetes bacterium Uphvl-Ar1]|nr:hypothetical protein CCB80_05325 [Armatimonadetes bacterium Uphvl-Ar1]
MDIFKTKLHSSNESLKVAVIGTFPPTKCGIATFTSDIASAIRSTGQEAEVDIYALSTQSESNYPESVRCIIQKNCQADYLEAASLINSQDYGTVLIQHEYGIFGGIAGSFLLDLIWNITTPVVTTLHTVLDDPSLTQKLVLEAILDRSQRIIVMSERAIDILETVHGIDRSKIDLIPHGTPSLPPHSGADYRLNTPPEAPLVLTFGLLSPDKGIEYVIEAFPAILEVFPGAKYAIVGATHPDILNNHGEEYRQSLISQSVKLGIQDNIIFIDEFVPLDSIVGYLKAADIYVTPYLKANQITSGTLAYAVGAGKAIVSTPYWYAEELLDEGRGVLVPFRDALSIAEAIVKIQSNPSDKLRMEQRAADFGKTMSWPSIGRQYRESLHLAVDLFQDSLLTQSENARPIDIHQLPELNLFHLEEMTDDCGMIQHAHHSTPLRAEGYCVDDNARALILTAILEAESELPEKLNHLQSRYLAFILHAFNSDGNRFRNFMSYDRNWLEQEGSEDSHARTVWALGTLFHHGRCLARREVAQTLFKDALPAFDSFSSPRAWAYGILGGEKYLRTYPHDLNVRQFVSRMSTRLLNLYKVTKTSDWHWFEDSLSYANARLSQAMIVSGHINMDEELLNAGIESLDWLRLIQTDKSGNFSPVGTSSYALHSKELQLFDQQPIEAAASVSAYLYAWEVTENSVWLSEAHRAFRWFLGGNILETPLYQPANGGCRDGLHPNRANENQGAESTLSFLTALTEMRSAVFPVTRKILALVSK